MINQPLIVVLGSARVGKTSILHKYLNGTFTCKYNETVEDLHIHDVAINGEKVMIEFLDTSGSTEFASLRNLAIKKASAFVLVFAIDRENSFAEMKRIWEEIKLTRSDHSEIPCMVIGNKLDRENYRKVEYLEALDWASNNGLEGMMQEVSSKTGGNFENVFEKLFVQVGLSEAVGLKSNTKASYKKSDKVANASLITKFCNWFACGKKETTS